MIEILHGILEVAVHAFVVGFFLWMGRRVKTRLSKGLGIVAAVSWLAFFALGYALQQGRVPTAWKMPAEYARIAFGCLIGVAGVYWYFTKREARWR